MWVGNMVGCHSWLVEISVGNYVTQRKMISWLGGGPVRVVISSNEKTVRKVEGRNIPNSFEFVKTNQNFGGRLQQCGCPVINCHFPPSHVIKIKKCDVIEL